METLRAGLRSRPPKPQKKVKTNAERCADYRTNLKHDVKNHQQYLLTKKLANLRWRQELSEEKKLEQREKNRLRQRNRRARLQNDGRKSAPATTSKTGTSKTTISSKPATRPVTRADKEKQKKGKENARLRQCKRRANMTDGTRKMENAKRRARYYRQKEEKSLKKIADTLKTQTSKSNRRVSFQKLIQNALRSISNKRDKESLLRQDVVKKLMKRTWEHQETHRKLKDMYKRKQPRDRKVEQFYEKESIDLPGKSTVSKTSMTQKKVLTMKIEDLFKVFQAENPSYKISLRTFGRRRPQHILLSSSRAFLQCLCEKCVNPMGKVEQLNQHLTTKINNVDQLVEDTLCKGLEFSRPCIERKCGSCGVAPVVDAWMTELEDQLFTEITWFRWEKSSYCGKTRVEKTGTMNELLQELKDEMEDLALHLKTARWQRKQYQHLLANLPAGHAVVTIDYAENYTCRHQNEPQSAHWNYRQISVHPCVLQYRCTSTVCSDTVTEYVNYVSDDLKHDAGFAKTVLTDVLNRLKEKGISNITIFSDGCSAQYKSKVPFVHLTELAEMFPDMLIERHYFGSHHGKSLCDAAGGIVKSCCTRAVANGRVTIQQASEMLKYCEKNLTISKDSNNCQHLLRSFMEVHTADVDRTLTSESLRTLIGTRSLHAVRPEIQFGKILKKQASCFCSSCLQGKHDCENEQFTGGWVPAAVLKKKQKLTVLTRGPWRCPKKGIEVDKENHHKQVPANTAPTGPENGTEVEMEENHVPVPKGQDNEQPDPSSRNSSKTIKDRQLFFTNLQTVLCAAPSFAELRQIAEEHAAEVESYGISTRSFSSCNFVIDGQSLDLYPEDGPALLPVAVYGDGNCLPRAGSLLAFGTEDHHIELRVRIACELALNSDIYRDDTFLSIGLDSPTECSKYYAQYSMHYNMETLTQGTIQDLFERETLLWVGNGTYAGQWQVHALSSVLGTMIQGIYPLYSGYNVRHHLHRLISPRQAADDVPTFVPGIMWTSTQGKSLPPAVWLPNHFVPCLPSLSSAGTPTQETGKPFEINQLNPGDFIKVKVLKESGSSSAKVTSDTVDFIASVTKMDETGDGAVWVRFLKSWNWRGKRAWKWDDAASYNKDYQVVAADIIAKMDDGQMHDDGRHVFYTFE